MKSLFFILILTMSIIAVMLSTVSTHSADEPPEDVPAVTVDQIVSQLHTVEELVSLKVAVSGIVSGTQPGARFWQGESSLVLLVRGQAIYGVDLSGVDVAVNGDRVTITLPEPRIIDHWVDVDRTETWQRRAGRFRCDDAQSLEQACWSSAKAIILEAAAQDRHREMARIRIERIIAELLRDAPAHTSVQVRWSQINFDA